MARKTLGRKKNIGTARRPLDERITITDARLGATRPQE